MAIISSLWASAFVVAVFFFEFYQLHASPLSHSTIDEKPLLLLISLDGMRYDFIRADLTPNIWQMANDGVFAPEGIKCQVITVTTPNHHCIATGLYQESHGIVENTFYDPVFDEFFDNWNFTKNDTRAKRSLLKHWFQMGEQQPIWRVNMKKSSHFSGSLNWPLGNSEYSDDIPKVHKSTGWQDYGNFSTWTKEIDQLIEWFTDPLEPINFGLYYNAQPDHVEHENDIEGPIVTETIEQLDNLIGYLISRLNDTNLLDKMDLILTADHGHTNIPDKNHVFNISKYINPDLVIRSAASFFPRVDLNVTAEDIYANLSAARIEHGLPIRVWHKNDFPEKYHFKNNRRVGPVIFFYDVHYINEDSPWPPEKPRHFPRGTHGYLNDYSEMRPFFVARGPSFKNNYRIEGGGSDFIENVDLYPLMCEILHVECGPNNGSLTRIGHILKNEPVNNSVGVLEQTF